MLSIIIPVLNGLEYTKQVLEDIKQYTKGEYEVLILISGYDTETIDNLDLESICKNAKDLKYSILDKTLWVNGAWNEGVKEAQGEYVAIINNDLRLSDSRDIKLIDGLKDTKLVYPAYTYGDEPGKIMYENRFGENICGWCFVMKKSDWKPIPEDIKIWFGDNYIDKYLDGNHKCIKDCIIHHFESKTITNDDFVGDINERILEDKRAWFSIKNNIGN